MSNPDHIQKIIISLDETAEAAHTMVSVIWNFYDHDTGNINERGKHFAAQIKHFLSPTHITALQNFIQLVAKDSK